MRVKAGECAEFLVRACDDKGRIHLSSRSADGSHSSSRSSIPPEQPIAVIARSGSKRWVSAADPAARAAGVHVGMPAAKAQSLFRGLMMVDADPEVDAAALERITLWALTIYSPIVAVDGIDGIVMDTEGADHLQGGELPMVTKIANQFLGRKLTARVAVADSWGAAHACARAINRETIVVPPGETVRAVEKLSISLLRLPSKIVSDLRILGFQTIGELANTPRAPLTLRFGPEIGRRLDQMLCRIAEPIEPVRTLSWSKFRKPSLNRLALPKRSTNMSAASSSSWSMSFTSAALGCAVPT